MAVLDRTGRLQLPKQYIDEFRTHGNDKIIVSKEGDKIILTVPKKD